MADCAGLSQKAILFKLEQLLVSDRMLNNAFHFFVV